MAKTFQPKPGATIVTLVCLCILVGLGVWQLQRLEWKTALIADITAKMAEEPSPLPETAENPKDWQYRRASVAGQYLNDKAFLVRPRTLDGKTGAHLVVPFKRASGGIVLVNRGWLPQENLPEITKTEGLTQIEGVAVVPEKHSFTPDNVPEKGDWYWIDAGAMSKFAGLGSASPVVLQITQSAAKEYPVAVAVTPDIPNDHRQYAFFWFSMAAILAAIYFIYHFQEDKKGEKNGSVQAA